jgi:hypothetical protein
LACSGINFEKEAHELPNPTLQGFLKGMSRTLSVMSILLQTWQAITASHLSKAPVEAVSDLCELDTILFP